MIDKRLMYALGQRVGFQGGGRDAGKDSDFGSEDFGGSNDTGNDDNDYNYTGPADLGVTTRTVNTIDAPEAKEFIGGVAYDVTPVTKDIREKAKVKQAILNPTVKRNKIFDPISKMFVDPFAPTVTKPSIWDGIKTFGTNALKAIAVSTGLTALGLSAKTVAIANTALGFGKQTGLTKSGSLGELGLNSLNNIGDMFGNTNDMFGGKNKGNTSTSDINNDIGNRGDGEGIASLQNQTAGYDEYILLLQKLQSGNITDSEKNRFNVLKNMLGI